MKTEFLKELGLEQEVIDKVMAENGRDVEAVKGKLTEKTAELATANQTITDLQATVKQFDGVDVAALNQKITELQTKYDDDLGKLKLDNAVDMALTQAKVHDVKAVRPFLDLGLVKLENDQLKGLAEQLADLKTEKGPGRSLLVVRGLLGQSLA